MTETLAVLAMLALRIAVPLLVIFGLSYVAYRWIGEEKPASVSTARQAAAATQRATLSGPAPLAQVLFTGVHCWDVKGCTDAMKATCPAVAKSELPCWLAIQMKTGHLKKNCPSCNFYERPVQSA
jgi:hypothetical protein